jgi:microcystin-dependent protein
LSDAYLGEIRLFPFNYAPAGWAICAGQILPLSQNTALFSLLGTFYGGDGRTTFGLPNLQGFTPINAGQSGSGTQYGLGQSGGQASVTLLQSEMPPHNHSFNTAAVNGTQDSSSGAELARATRGGHGTSVSADLYTSSAPNATMAAALLSPNGTSGAHNNMQPYLVLNPCIALRGDFPQRP